MSKDSSTLAPSVHLHPLLFTPFVPPSYPDLSPQIFLDQESSDVKCIVSCWIRRQPEELQIKLQGWIDDFFFRALSHVLETNAPVVQTTTAGVVNNALSHLVGVSTKAEFVVAAVRGFGSNLMLAQREELAKKLYTWANENHSDHRRPLDRYLDKRTGEMKLFQACAPPHHLASRLPLSPTAPS